MTRANQPGSVTMHLRPSQEDNSLIMVCLAAPSSRLAKTGDDAVSQQSAERRSGDVTSGRPDGCA